MGKMYKKVTGEATPTLRGLRAGRKARPEDILALWDVYVEGTREVGCAPTIVDFGAWLAGKGALEAGYTECEPAELLW
jgi:hypothetical protein